VKSLQSHSELVGILPAYLNRPPGVFNLHYLQHVRIDDSPGDTEYQFTVWAQKMPVLGSFGLPGNNVKRELVHVVKAVRAQGRPTHLLTNEVLRLGSIIGERQW